jgi:thioredoxin-related protein
LAQKYGVRYTPTIQFFPDSMAGLAAKTPKEREITRIQGYLAPAAFLMMFRFVAERAYEKGTLRDYLKANS